METVVRVLGLLRRFGQKAGPYLMLEMVMPGGTLLALLLFLYQRWQPEIGGFAQRTGLAVTRVLASFVE
jgi:hypothetical protein